MEKSCNNCRFKNVPYDEDPCLICKNNTSLPNASKSLKWEIEEPLELLQEAIDGIMSLLQTIADIIIEAAKKILKES